MTDLREIEPQPDADAIHGGRKVLQWGTPKKAASVQAPVDPEPPVEQPVKQDNVSILTPKPEPVQTLMQRVAALVFGSILVVAWLVFTYLIFARHAPLLALFAVTFLFVGLRMFRDGLKPHAASKPAE